MYRHLLVPLDDSPLSVDTVGQAVEFARALGAKVTFFHAQADYGATSIGALERVMSPAAFNERHGGEARGILAKARSRRARGGRRPRLVVVTSDRPYEAILDAAEARGCDLIFMASHGRRGLQGPDARLADAEGAAARDHPGAGVVGREQRARRGHRRRRSRSSATSTARSRR